MPCTPNHLVQFGMVRLTANTKTIDISPVRFQWSAVLAYYLEALHEIAVKSDDWCHISYRFAENILLTPSGTIV